MWEGTSPPFVLPTTWGLIPGPLFKSKVGRWLNQMSYSQLTDIKFYLTPDIIQQLTDDGNLDELDENIISYATTQADGLIDSYLRGRYTTPIIDDPLPTLIIELSARLTIFFLYKRQLARILPDPIKEDYNYCIRTLVGIQTGKISPFQTSEEPVLFRSSKDQDDFTFTNRPPSGGQAFQPSIIGGTDTVSGFGQNSWKTYRI